MAFFDAKSNRAAWLFRRTHELTDGIENYFELNIILLFQFVETARKVGMARQHLAEANERSHNLDVDADGAPTAKDTR